MVPYSRIDHPAFSRQAEQPDGDKLCSEGPLPWPRTQTSHQEGRFSCSQEPGACKPNCVTLTHASSTGLTFLPRGQTEVLGGQKMLTLLMYKAQIYISYINRYTIHLWARTIRKNVLKCCVGWGEMVSTAGLTLRTSSPGCESQEEFVITSKPTH